MIPVSLSLTVSLYLSRTHTHTLSLFFSLSFSLSLSLSLFVSLSFSLSLPLSGASIADIVVLLVAADEEIGSQTEESIGILQTLNADNDIPCIVCINKIDKLPPSEFVPRLLALETKLREYEKLDNARMIPISAKNKVNLHFLSAVLQDEWLKGEKKKGGVGGASSRTSGRRKHRNRAIVTSTSTQV